MPNERTEEKEPNTRRRPRRREGEPLSLANGSSYQSSNKADGRVGREVEPSEGARRTKSAPVVRQRYPAAPTRRTTAAQGQRQSFRLLGWRRRGKPTPVITIGSAVYCVAYFDANSFTFVHVDPRSCSHFLQACAENRQARHWLTYILTPADPATAPAEPPQAELARIWLVMIGIVLQ